MSGAGWELAPEEFTSGRAALEVWTEKDGLLARAAHDLCLRAEAASVELRPEGEGWALEVRVPIQSLRVRGQVKGRAVTPLSSKDHAEIEKNLRGAKILDAARYPEAIYRGTCVVAGDRARVEGTLTLRAARRPLALEGSWRAQGSEEEARQVEVSGEVVLRQSEWGLAPFSALLGAIKLKDSLRVSWRLVLTRV